MQLIKLCLSNVSYNWSGLEQTTTTVSFFLKFLLFGSVGFVFGRVGFVIEIAEKSNQDDIVCYDVDSHCFADVTFT